MRKLCIFLVFLNCLVANAQLVSGNIMFVGYNADGSDGFAIVALVDIPINSTIYFSDNEWNGSDVGSGGAFINTTEGEMTWSSGGSIITAGTVVIFNETGSGSNPGYGSTVGSIAGNINLNADNEVLYAYLGSNDVTPTIFLSAIANSGFSAGNGTLTGTGLISGTSAISITGDADVMIYNGSTVCNSTPAACAAQIASSIDWILDDGSGDQSNDANAPDFPADLPPSFTGDALPIELYSFEVTKTIGKKVLIKWVTLSEINNDYFTIERSSDMYTWKPIGELSGAGNSLIKNSYYYEDELPIFGEYYYRLKQTDFDGNFSYSATKVIQADDSEAKFVYPNPTEGLVNITSEGEARFMSISGEDLTNRISIYRNSTETILDISSLPNGIYFIRVGSDFQKIVKH